MTTDAARSPLKPTTYRLSDEHRRRISAIAEALSRKTGLDVDDSKALRHAIDRVFLAECAVDGSSDDVLIAA